MGSQWIAVDMNDPARNQAIADVMMHYQWPMVIDTQLTSVEKDELLSSDKPYAEERFIAKKLQEIDPFYDIVFIPTTLYELFAMSYIDNRKKILKQLTFDISEKISAVVKDSSMEQNQKIQQLIYLRKEFEKTRGEDLEKYEELKKFNVNRPDLDGLLNKFINYTTIGKNNTLRNISLEFNQINKKYYPDLFLKINQELYSYLVNNESQVFEQAQSGFDISEKIESQIYPITASCITNHKNNFKSKFQDEIIDYPDLTTLNYDGILASAIILDYQARKKNQGLLLRVSEDIIIDNQPIVTSSIKVQPSSLTLDLLEKPIEHYSTLDLSQKVTEKGLRHYSASWGNSLFAGYLYDYGACAYYYANRYSYKTGVGIFVDKKVYYNNPLENVFTIPALGTLASLLSEGEWFHARSKSAGYLPGYNNKPDTVLGIGDGRVVFKDATKYIKTDKDPLEFGIKYSETIANNMYIFKPKREFSKFDINNNSYIHPEKIHKSSIVQQNMQLNTAPYEENQQEYTNTLKQINQKIADKAQQSFLTKQNGYNSKEDVTLSTKNSDTQESKIPSDLVSLTGNRIKKPSTINYVTKVMRYL